MENTHSSKIRILISAELKSIVPGFLKNRQEELKAIANYLARNDFGALQKIGHTLKGNAGAYGFAELGNLGAQLEVASKNQLKDTATTILVQMSSYLENIEVQYVEEE